MITERNIAKKKIVIAEDDKTLLEALVDKFMSENLEVFKAENGKDALELITNQRPDLVLLDILMPEMDGLEVMRSVRAMEWGKNTPIVLLTNVEPDHEIAKQISSQPPAYYFVKADSDLDFVVSKVMELVSEQK